MNKPTKRKAQIALEKKMETVKDLEQRIIILEKNENCRQLTKLINDSRPWVLGGYWNSPHTAAEKLLDKYKLVDIKTIITILLSRGD